MNGLLSIDKIYELDAYLEELLENNQIYNYKIVLQLASRIEVNILLPEMKGKKWYFEREPFKDCEKLIKINEIEFDEAEQREYELIFKSKIDLGLRRRLTNLIDPNNKEVIKPCPVITFYSYKGGTGRTTSLAFFASWLATNHGKKVVIIDCDFEAPGLTNYFDISEDRKGILEYLLDAEYAKLKNESLDITKDYSHKVRHEYVGKGEVFIVPAGNLSSELIGSSSRSYRSDYLEALARLDITSTHHIIQQFQDFFEDLKNQINLNFENSVILIDSRTGFNDTFATLATLSDIIVGFFGINKQSQVGITQFLDNFGTINNTQNKQILLVNSISESRDYEVVFREFVNQYISQNESSFTEVELGKKDFVNNIFRIPRSQFLGKLGTALEVSDRGILKMNGYNGKNDINLEFYDKIQDPDSEFKHFFQALNEKISFLVDNKEEDKETPQKETEHIEYSPSKEIQSIDEVFFQNIFQKVNKIERRERLLRTLASEEKFPKPYADSEVPVMEGFFFRNCLKDIFNRDKFIIVGYKGTGKTHIYQAFKNVEITNSLCKRENQNSNNFIFVNVIPVDEAAKYFNTNDKFSKEDIEKIGIDTFYSRFWQAYVWNQVFSHEAIKPLKIQLSSEIQQIINDNDSANWFRKVIENNEVITKFENDLKLLDKKLKEINKIIILSFDQLDFVVKPENWSEGIAPLITYYRNNTFSRIYPKIFVRADIFENRISNITNIGELLKEKSISLQWSKEELFAYFFKFVFRVGKEDFFALSYNFHDYSLKTTEKLLKIENSLDSEGQITVSAEDDLKLLVSLFFGKNANRYEQNTDFGTTYDWFYRNLTDAKGTISIRPFLDLLKKAMESALTKEALADVKRYHYKQKQVLSAFYFTHKDATAYAAERYYTDLARDKGNEPLNLFHKYIKEDGLERFRIYEFKREQMDELLRRIIEFPNYKNEISLKEISIDNFKNLLINNGILQVTHITNRQLTRYIIPFLYRSFFGVGNPNKSRN